MSNTESLPALPEPLDTVRAYWRGDSEFLTPHGHYFTAEQMHAYAAEAVRVALGAARDLPAVVLAPSGYRNSCEHGCNGCDDCTDY